MWKEAALLAVGCVLFVNMGLADAIQETIGIHSRILSCPKCCVFWATFAFLVINRCRFFTAVGASFLFSYIALWADLGLSALNRKYNELYEQLSEPSAAKAGVSKKRRRDSTAGKDRAGVPKVRNKQQ